MILEIRPQRVRIAMDADFRQNPAVGNCILQLLERLKPEDIECVVEVWDPGDGKGIDDVLVAGGETGLLIGDEFRGRFPDVGRPKGRKTTGAKRKSSDSKTQASTSQASRMSTVVCVGDRSYYYDAVRDLPFLLMPGAVNPEREHDERRHIDTARDLGAILSAPGLHHPTPTESDPAVYARGCEAVTLRNGQIQTLSAAAAVTLTQANCVTAKLVMETRKDADGVSVKDDDGRAISEPQLKDEWLTTKGMPAILAHMSSYRSSSRSRRWSTPPSPRRLAEASSLRLATAKA